MSWQACPGPAAAPSRARGRARPAAVAYPAGFIRIRRRQLRRFEISRPWRRGLWGVLLLTAALGATLFAQWRPAGPLTRCHAVDGDTLRCGAERVRVVGLDTPEMQGRCAAESRLARRAQERLAALSVEGVSLEARGRDRYDRLLAIVRDRDGRDVAAILIREGLARPYDGRGPRASWC